MSNLADLISNVDSVIPPDVFNAKTIWKPLGTDIPSHDLNQDVGAIVCSGDGSGFLADHMYIINKDKTGWVDVFKQHKHTSDTDGGTLFDIKFGNAKDILEMNFHNLRKGQFVCTATTTGGTATITDQRDSTSVYVECVSPISTAYCNMEAGGLRLFFGKPFIMQAKYKVFENTNILWRIGSGLSTIETSGSQAQIGWEGCSSDIRYAVVSANGTSRTPSYGTNMLQSNPLGLRIEWYPNDKIIATDGLGTLINKTDNLPLVSSSTNENATFRVGHKTTNTSVGTSRAFRIYAANLVGYNFDSSSGVGQWL